MDEPVDLKGNYDTVTAKTLSIVLKRCDPEVRSTCKSEDEINRWLSDKYIIMVENNPQFRQDVYKAHARVLRKSRFLWFPVTPRGAIEFSRMFQVKDLVFQDSFLQIGGYTEEK